MELLTCAVRSDVGVLGGLAAGVGVGAEFGPLRAGLVDGGEGVAGCGEHQGAGAGQTGGGQRRAAQQARAPRPSGLLVWLVVE
jgi:hypothetical protein